MKKRRLFTGILGVISLLVISIGCFIYDQLYSKVECYYSTLSSDVGDSSLYRELLAKVELQDPSASHVLLTVGESGMAHLSKRLFILYGDKKIISTDPASPTGFSTWTLNDKSVALFKEALAGIDKIEEPHFENESVTDLTGTDICYWKNGSPKHIFVTGKLVKRWTVGGMLEGAVSTPRVLTNLYRLTCMARPSCAQTWPEDFQIALKPANNLSAKTRYENVVAWQPKAIGAYAITPDFLKVVTRKKVTADSYAALCNLTRLNKVVKIGTVLYAPRIVTGG